MQKTDIRSKNRKYGQLRARQFFSLPGVTGLSARRRRPARLEAQKHPHASRPAPSLGRFPGCFSWHIPFRPTPSLPLHYKNKNNRTGNNPTRRHRAHTTYQEQEHLKPPAT